MVCMAKGSMSGTDGSLCFRLNLIRNLQRTANKGKDGRRDSWRGSHASGWAKQRWVCVVLPRPDTWAHQAF